MSIYSFTFKTIIDIDAIDDIDAREQAIKYYLDYLEQTRRKLDQLSNIRSEIHLRKLDHIVPLNLR